MLKLILAGAVLISALAACQPGKVQAPAKAELADALVRLDGPGPPPAGPGECWASSVTPAVIETITEQILVSEAVLDDAGRTITPAIYETKTHQRMVNDREEVWFRAPCPEDMTAQFVATLQRALKARGLYALPVTGVADAATAESVRRFQAGLGLDSPILSLAAARALGISSADLSSL
jgi:hypothetical protein